jgi:hypothetical protein
MPFYQIFHEGEEPPKPVKISMNEGPKDIAISCCPNRSPFSVEVARPWTLSAKWTAGQKQDPGMDIRRVQ